MVQAADLDADLQLRLVTELGLVRQAEEADLVQRVSRVGDQLPQEDVLGCRCISEFATEHCVHAACRYAWIELATNKHAGHEVRPCYTTREGGMHEW